MIKIISLIFLILNYRAFISQNLVSREIRVLLLVFVLDVSLKVEPDFIVVLFGKKNLFVISALLLLAQVLLLSICYLKNQRQVFINHYIFIAFLGLIAVAAISSVFTKNVIFQLVQLLACAGAVVFGILNTYYKKQQQ